MPWQAGGGRLGGRRRAPAAGLELGGGPVDSSATRLAEPGQQRPHECAGPRGKQLELALPRGRAFGGRLSAIEKPDSRNHAAAEKNLEPVREPSAERGTGTFCSQGT